MAQPPHDPHLAAALRHAPDADEAPPELSRAILQAAEQAARRPPAMPAAPVWERWLERLQRWLQAPRLAGGAAALMLAVLIGSLWGPTPDTSPVPQRETLPLPAAAPKAEAPAGPVASAAATAPAAADTVQEAARRPFAAQQAEAPRRRPSAAPPAARTAEPERRVAAPAAPPTAAAPSADHAAPAAESVAAAPPPPAAAPAPQPLSKAAPEAAGVASTMARSAAEPPSLVRMRLAAVVADEHAGATTTQRRAEANAPRLAFAPPASPLRGWLLQLSQAAAGRWIRQPADATLPADTPSWSFAWPPGSSAPQATIRLYGRTLWWQEADGSLWRAELPSGAALPAPPEPAASAAR